MKKTYVKPRVYFESFQLSANIASGCSLKLGHDAETCIWQDGVESIFAGTNNLCTLTPDKANNICYDIPTAGLNLFDS